MESINLTDKQLTFIILALEHYAQALTEDEDDPGPSMSDSLYAIELAKQMRQHAKQPSSPQARRLE